MKRTYAVIGLGYVGIELFIAIAKSNDVIGYDKSKQRIGQLLQGFDANGIVNKETLQCNSLELTDNINDIRKADFYIVTVPTPAYFYTLPNLEPLEIATRELANIIKSGDIIVYESTVYPGATEEVCIPIIEEISQLKCGKDFNVGYSPERINAKDKIYTLEKITKVVGAQNKSTVQEITNLYKKICQSVHVVSSIKAAEATKILENCQRDVNIAFINEFSQIMHALNINTQEVITAAKTKWNFVDFKPGLVGGHCIAVDPLYLVFKAERHGMHANLISAARRVNDDMTHFIINEMFKYLARQRMDFKQLKVGILGVSYKANVPDIRNSLSLKLIKELKTCQFDYSVQDPHASKEVLSDKYHIELQDYEAMQELNVIILTVGHQFYLDKGLSSIVKKLHKTALLMDIPALFTDDSALNLNQITYWTL